MSRELERMVGKSVMSSKSVSGAAGKGLVVGGGAAIALTFLAALIPFVGVFGLGVVMLVLGAFMWE